MTGSAGRIGCLLGSGLTRTALENWTTGLTLRTMLASARSERKRATIVTCQKRSCGMFQRAFWLPENVDRKKIAAAFAQGVLTVTLRTPAKAAPKKVGVRLPPEGLSTEGRTLPRPSVFADRSWSGGHRVMA